MHSLVFEVILSLLSVAVLIISAHFVVNQIIKIAHYFGVSSSFMGLTVLSLGTSLPEIASHLIASVGILSGSLNYEIASSTVLGANIGSDVIQQTLVLGIVILMVGKLDFGQKDFLKKSYTLMVGTTLMCIILGLDRVYSRVDGAILFGSFLAYMYYLYKKEEQVEHEKVKMHHSIWYVSFLGILAMAVMIISSHVALKTIEHIVEGTGIAGSLIGMMTLGVASAMPEMFTAIAGIRKKENGIAVGTLIGSNITNPLVAIGLGALVSTYYVPRPLVYWDLPMETITALLLLVWILKHDKKVEKGGAIYLIVMYVVYLVVRILFFNVD